MLLLYTDGARVPGLEGNVGCGKPTVAEDSDGGPELLGARDLGEQRHGQEARRLDCGILATVRDIM